MKKGMYFTPVEWKVLIWVVTISVTVAVLATVVEEIAARPCAPRWSEGLACMGAITTAIRAYAKEHDGNELPKDFGELGFKPGELTGTYFKETDYSFVVKSIKPLQFMILTRPSSEYNWNPKASTLDQDSNYVEIEKTTSMNIGIWDLVGIGIAILIVAMVIRKEMLKLMASRKSRINNS